MEAEGCGHRHRFIAAAAERRHQNTGRPTRAAPDRHVSALPKAPRLAGRCRTVYAVRRTHHTADRRSVAQPTPTRSDPSSTTAGSGWPATNDYRDRQSPGPPTARRPLMPVSSARAVRVPQAYPEPLGLSARRRRIAPWRPNDHSDGHMPRSPGTATRRGSGSPKPASRPDAGRSVARRPLMRSAPAYAAQTASHTAPLWVTSTCVGDIDRKSAKRLPRRDGGGSLRIPSHAPQSICSLHW